jgi:four helix bundle protein
MQDYQSLKVWEKAHRFTLDIYGITKEFPQIKLYGLLSQIRRASVSITTNIAEGTNKKSKKDFIRFLETALCSAQEVEYELLLSNNLEYVSEHKFVELDNQIKEKNACWFNQKH